LTVTREREWGKEEEDGMELGRKETVRCEKKKER
jgi:hypothetical protein